VEVATRKRIATSFASLPLLWPLLLLVTYTSGAPGAVRVIVGPTPIPAGDARAASDITVMNEKLAFAIAVGSSVPYGVPHGAIVDVAPIKDGKPGRDRIVFADFIPNNWSAWPNTYHDVHILERGPDRAVIRSVRDWGRVTIATVYTLRASSDHVEIRTQMTNDGDVALPDLLSGLTLWPNSGFVFQVPGLAGTEQGSADGALSDRVVAYDEDWAVTLHAPYLDHIAHSSLDLYRLHTLAPHATRDFEGWLQVGSNGDLAPVLRAEIERKQLASGRVHGVVKGQDGSAIDHAVVIVEKEGKPYAWALADHGAYELMLPIGDYRLEATARNRSQSEGTLLTVRAGENEVRDFADLKAPGRVHLSFSDARNGKPLDARINITEGQKPLVGFLGRNTFFTDLDPKGQLDTQIAPGHYVFTASSGGGFLGPSRRVEAQVESNKTQVASITLTRLFDPPARGWYSADLHHHADQAEAVTPPADLARSELAAGLDVLFVSDHDSTVNHERLREIAASRGMVFVAGVELSASWGHFNAYPLRLGEKLQVDTGTATIEQIFQEARRQGAIVVQANHPFIPYGYFTSLGAGTVPGGFNPSFDLMEINAQAPTDDEKVLHALWKAWTEGHHYYLSAGSDTHDVWNDVSGRVRVFAHVEGKLTPDAFAEALKAGHGYVTHGPLIFPSVIFGEERKVKPGEPVTLAFDLQAVGGLKSIQLIGRGGVVVAEKSFPQGQQQEQVAFPVTTSHSSWYAVVVEDWQEKKAYSDPIWIDVVASGF
jgi:hypothetical protein